MANKDESLELTTQEVERCFNDPVWSERFPPVMNPQQAGELLQIPEQTIYDWRSRGLLKGCCRKLGKHLRFFRDRLVLLAFNQGIT